MYDRTFYLVDYRDPLILSNISNKFAMKMYWSVEYVLLDQYTMSWQVTVSKLIFSSNEIRLNLVVPMFHLNEIEHRFQKPKSRKFDQFFGHWLEIFFIVAFQSNLSIDLKKKLLLENFI